MTSTRQLEKLMSVILLLGMLFAVLLVIMGALIFLWQHGSELLNHNAFMAGNSTPIHYVSLLQAALHLQPLSIIECGILVLVLTQIVRVGLITTFYLLTKDYSFVLISGFILLVLIYSFIWQIH